MDGGCQLRAVPVQFNESIAAANPIAVGIERPFVRDPLQDGDNLGKFFCKGAIAVKRMDAPGRQLAWLKIKNPATRARRRLHSGPGEARRANESSRPRRDIQTGNVE